MKKLSISKGVHLCVLLALFSLFDATVTAQRKNRNGKQSFHSIDTAAIERIMGIKGKYNNGEYKITIPQNDLDVKVDGFKIIPAMGLGTWVAFTPAKEGVMVMGDIIV